jgi:thiol-disulfide isomerase/thioredoxin
MRPDFSLPDLEARQHGPGEWGGKVLILNFWASWCPPCLQEIPAFIRLQEKYAGRGVQFVGIAVQQAEEVRDFVVAKGINYPVLTGEAEVIKVAEDYGNLAGTLPYTVIIDREQRIAFIKRGPLAEVEAERVINSLTIAK